MIENKLPRIPSKLIRLALKDLEESINQGMSVDMNCWVEKQQEGTCAVCFAGAVMMQSLNASKILETDSCTGPDDMSSKLAISESDRYALHALNEFRLGRAYAGLSFLDLEDVGPSGMKFHIPLYSEDSPGLFFDAMERMAKEFESRGF